MSGTVPELPLEVRWSVEAGGFFLPRVAPLVEDGTVAVRCGDAVLRLDATSGAVAWRADVGPRAGDGAFLAPLGGDLVTDVVRRPERLARLVGITTGGERAWETDLDAILAPGAAAPLNGALFVLGIAPAESATVVWRVDPDGRVAEAFRPAWGASALTAAGDRLLIRNGFPGSGPGLYTIAPDGSAATGLVDDPVLSGEPPAVVTRAADGTHVLRVLDGWTRPVDGEAVATAEDVVIAVEAGRIVARALADGAERWSAVAPATVLTLHAADGVVLASHLLGVRLLHAADGRTLDDPDGTWGAPVLAGGVLVLAGEGHVLGTAAPRGDG